MNVSQLKKALEAYPDHLEVILNPGKNEIANDKPATHLELVPMYRRAGSQDEWRPNYGGVEEDDDESRLVLGLVSGIGFEWDIPESLRAEAEKIREGAANHGG